MRVAIHHEATIDILASWISRHEVWHGDAVMWYDGTMGLERLPPLEALHGPKQKIARIYISPIYVPNPSDFLFSAGFQMGRLTPNTTYLPNS